MYKILLKILFIFPPETAHNITFLALNTLNKLGILKLFKPSSSSKQTIQVMGIEFPNRIGLAAGLDKNGSYISALSNLGFGFVEIGTVTPRAQSGNPKPRLFRLPEAKAIINRMGFNNHGIDHLIENVNKLKGSGFDGIIGINIGKNLDTAVDSATEDYLIGLRQAYFYADYITVNISSPNTPGLRTLQYGEELNELLSSIKDEQMKLALQYKKYIPIAIKVAPDLSNAEVKDIAETILEKNMDCVIATNTTISREAVDGLGYSHEAGGLSGIPVREQSTKIIAEFHKYLKDQIPIIGVGGISSPQDVEDKLNAGAVLVQLYTGLIYKGPGLIKKLINVNVDSDVISVDQPEEIDPNTEESPASDETKEKNQ